MKWIHKPNQGRLTSFNTQYHKRKTLLSQSASLRRNAYLAGNHTVAAAVIKECSLDRPKSRMGGRALSERIFCTRGRSHAQSPMKESSRDSFIGVIVFHEVSILSRLQLGWKSDMNLETRRGVG